ncbi:MAG: type III pantothenate kinase [Candidatus Geothermincolia bacterium]
MLLAIDVGNTQTVIGVYQEEELICHWRVSTEGRRTGDELALYFQGLLALKGMHMEDFDGVVISSVVPDATMALEEMTRLCWSFEPLILGHNAEFDLDIQLENPTELGPDRIANAIGAFERYGEGKPLIVVDFGTATTCDAISANGAYLGGAIAPGIEISSRALFTKAARLAKVELHEPTSVIGKNSIASLQAGIIYGFAGQVDRLVEMMTEELGGDSTVIATGGLAQVVLPFCRTIAHHDPLLTLHGLRLLYRSNRG